MNDDAPETPDARGGLSRRRFLLVAGGAAAGAVAGGALWSALVREHLSDATSAPTSSAAGGAAAGGPEPAGGNRVLVVLQMNGGNDGLNTLIPANDGAYFDNRPKLQVKEGDIATLAGAQYGLHPSLKPLVPLWDAGRLVPIDAIGFLQGQTRSHFQAMDLWWSAMPNQARTTGWLGRWLDRSGDPTNPLRAIALGSGSPALVGDKAMSTVVLDPSAFKLLAPKGADVATLTKAFAATATPLASDPDLAAAQGSVPTALHAVDLLAKVTDDGSGGGTAPGATAKAPANKGVTADGDKGDFTTLLDTAAGIIDLQIGTQVIVVSATGFDTHANQATTQPQLLQDLATGVTQFIDAIDKQGRGDQVLVMTTSEFGRRVKENGSGTDHGEGGVQFLVGNAVHGKQVVGDADLAHLDDGDVRSTIDTRSMYASVLDWLGGADTNDILGGSFDRHGLLNA
jgi:uncharacterized protein (DUF1501 family)